MPIINGHYSFLNFGSFTRLVLIDTGASISMVSLAFLKVINPALTSQISESDITTVRLVDGTNIRVIGQLSLPFYLNGHKARFTFQILSDMTYPAILGLDFFQHFDCTFDYSTHTFSTKLPQATSFIGVCEHRKNP